MTKEWHTRATELHQLHNGNMSQHLRLQYEAPIDIVMETEEDPHPSQETSHPPLGLPPDVMLETQFNMSNRFKSNIYKDILASIGLDNPTTSQKARGRERNSYFNQLLVGHLASTPICNSASSLMALGQHAMTPRQWRIWESRNKSPLGGQ